MIGWLLWLGTAIVERLGRDPGAVYGEEELDD